MKYAWHKNVYNVECFLVSGIFHGHFAQRLAVNKPCLQIVRRLLWKQTTTHSIRNNNPIFDREEPLVKQIRPTVYMRGGDTPIGAAEARKSEGDEDYLRHHPSSSALSPQLLTCGSAGELLKGASSPWNMCPFVETSLETSMNFKDH